MGDGQGNRPMQDATAPLDEDRPQGPDIERLAEERRKTFQRRRNLGNIAMETELLGIYRINVGYIFECD